MLLAADLLYLAELALVFLPIIAIGKEIVTRMVK